MMETIEVSARSLDEAKKAAADKLGVAVAAIQVTVLEESKGLFGKGGVKIRAEVGDEPAPKKGKAAKEKPEPKAKAQPEPEPQPEEKPAPKAKAAPRATKAKAAPQEDSSDEITTKDLAEQSEEGDRTGAEATQEDADQLAALVDEILDRSGLEVSVRVTAFQGRYVNIEIDGKDAAFLIGKHGEVLNALQYLVNIIAGRKFQNGVRATLDGANYRRKREEALTGLAQKIADQVAKRGEEAVLDALPAFERRIVHKALADNPKVATYSEGEEPNRRVVIAPAD